MVTALWALTPHLEHQRRLVRRALQERIIILPGKAAAFNAVLVFTIIVTAAGL